MYADLRLQLGVPRDLAPAAARELVRRLTSDMALSFPLRAFLFGLTTFNWSLEKPILDLLRLFLSKAAPDAFLLDAWAELLSLGESPDEDAIWRAITQILSPPVTPGSSPRLKASSPHTPRKPPPELPDDTPVHATSGLLFSESAHTFADVDPYLRTELRNTVFKDVQGFHTLFPGITESEWACAVRCPSSCACGQPEPPNHATYDHEFARFPSQLCPSEPSVIEWFHNFIPRSGSRRFHASSSKTLDRSSCTRQCDVFLGPMSGNNQDRHSWYDVLVPGKLKAAPGKDCGSDTIVQLAGYVREVFGAQVNRRFVHAFTICGPVFRCYFFDRSGVSISDRLDIRKNEKTENLFVRILLGYIAMSPHQLGFDTNYTTKDGIPFIPCRSVPLPTHLTFGGSRFQLVEKLFHRPVIVSRGTLCWLAHDECGQVCVIKDTWRAGWRISEGELLSLAESRRVWGLPQPLMYGDVINISAGDALLDCISQLRSPLSYAAAKGVLQPEKYPDSIYLLSSRVVPNSSASSAKSKKRSALDSLSAETRKLAKVDGSRTSEAGLKSRGERSADGPTPPTPLSIGTVSPLDKPFIDRTHSMIIFNAVGKRIEEFASIRELLEAFRDAIRCKCYQ